MLLRSFLVWIPMVFIAIFNGTIRELVYGPSVTELLAHQISTLTGIILVSLYLYFIFNKLKIKSNRDAFIVGALWVVYTIIFEVVFGHFVMGHPFSILLRDYNLLAGRVWIIFLLWTLIMPVLFFNIRNKRSINA